MAFTVAVPSVPNGTSVALYAWQGSAAKSLAGSVVETQTVAGGTVTFNNATAGRWLGVYTVGGQQAWFEFAVGETSGGGGSGSAVTASSTKRVTLPIGAGAGAYSSTAALDHNPRTLIKLPVATTRWRLRVRNYSALNNVANTGAITIKGVWLGTPSLVAAGRWAGALTTTPAQALGADATPADGSEYTSAWVTDPSLQFPANTLQALSMGFTNGAGITFNYDYVGFFLAGTGSAAAGGASGAGAFTQRGLSVLDVRLEYEFVTTNVRPIPIVAVFGDSIAQGYCGGLNPPPTGVAAVASLFPFEAWPGALALGRGCAVVNNGVGGSRTSNWTAGNDFKWTRCDWATTIPDVGIVALGINDVTNSVAAATIEANLQTVIANVRALGIPRVYLATMHGNGFAGALETARVAVNTWIRHMPDGIDGIVEFDKAMYGPLATGSATPDTDMVPNSTSDPTNGYSPHPSPGGMMVLARAAGIVA